MKNDFTTISLAKALAYDTEQKYISTRLILDLKIPGTKPKSMTQEKMTMQNVNKSKFDVHLKANDLGII